MSVEKFNRFFYFVIDSLLEKFNSVENWIIFREYFHARKSLLSYFIMRFPPTWKLAPLYLHLICGDESQTSTLEKIWKCLNKRKYLNRLISNWSCERLLFGSSISICTKASEWRRLNELRKSQILDQREEDNEANFNEMGPCSIHSILTAIGH